MHCDNHIFLTTKKKKDNNIFLTIKNLSFNRIKKNIKRKKKNISLQKGKNIKDSNFTSHILVEHDMHGLTTHDHFQQDPAEYELD